MSVDFAKDERSISERIASPDQLLVGKRDERIGAFNRPQGFDEPVDHLRAPAARDEMKNSFRVGGRLIDCAALHKIAAERKPIGEIAIMRDREAPRTEFGEKRLDIAQNGFARRRITHMADGGFSGQTLDRRCLGEMIADKTEPAFGIVSVAVESNDARRLLTAMLQGMQSKSCDRCGGGMAENSENPAFLPQTVGLEVKIEGAGFGILPIQRPWAKIKALCGVLRFTHRHRCSWPATSSAAGWWRRPSA